MKKLVLVIQLIAIINLNGSSQIFNTSNTLKPRLFCVGFEPGLYVNGGADAYFFLHGGVGISHRVDLGAKIGLGGNKPYIGGDVKFAFGKIFSLTAGAHSWGNFGLDVIALFTIPVSKRTNLFTGLDSDINFADNIEVPVWIPVGIDISIQKSIYFIIETEINVTSNWGHFFGSGLNFVF
jgi:hypothetical protein